LTIRAHKAALEGAPDAEAAIAAAWGSDDLQEGLAAFRERRRPVFRAR
jgi:enoyl-CoA hydratase/carnithine racemase